MLISVCGRTVHMNFRAASFKFLNYICYSYELVSELVVPVPTFVYNHFGCIDSVIPPGTMRSSLMLLHVIDRGICNLGS